MVARIQGDVSRFQQLRAIVLLPGMVLVVIPALMLFLRGVNPLWGLPAPWSWLVILLSAAFIVAGILLLVQTISLIARVGQGTLAPWNPTRRLVVRGIYRHVRNPMISGVFCVLMGETLLFGSSALLGWFILCVVANLLYIPLSEEPGLERRFGQDYVRYKKNVPRWIPRLTAWEMRDVEK